MADKYLWSGATGTGTGASWANAYTLMATAAAGMAAGDTLWVAHVHAESSATAQTSTFPGTAAAPNRVISVNKAGSVPPVAADFLAGATVTTTGASGIIANGNAYFYGLTFNIGSGANTAVMTQANAGAGVQRYDACTFNVVATNAASGVTVGAGATNSVDWSNCSTSFAAITQSMTVNGSFKWANKTAAAVSGTIPTTLIVGAANRTTIDLVGLDLSAFVSGKTLVGTAIKARTRIAYCKLDAAVTVAATPNGSNALGTYLIGSNSTGNVERNEVYTYQGTLTTETTVIRSAGASDGTTPYSWKVVSTANNKIDLPFETLEGRLWNAQVGSSRTLTFHCLTDNVALTNADIFVEVEYLGDAGDPQTSLVSSGPATIITSGSALTSDSGEPWTTTGIVTPNKQKFSVSFTPQIAGPIRWKVKIPKASATIYVDPNPDLT